MRAFFTQYKKFIQTKWKTNIKNVMLGDYDESKINTHAMNMDIDFVEFVNAINNNNIFASYILAKDPSKQNIQEEFQKQYVNKKCGYDAITLLPKRNNHIFYKGKLKTKTADAIINIKGQEYICSMKLIQQSGGAQDNQRKDLQFFLAAASDTVKVIGLVDDTHDSRSEFYMKGVSNRNNAFLFNSDELAEFIKEENK